MYTYCALLDEVDRLSCMGLKTGSIGFSEDGRPIPYVFVGSDDNPVIFITAGIHAREHISSYLCIRQIHYAADYFNLTKRCGGIYFIPMLNPDGNEILTKGCEALCNKNKAFLRDILKDSDPMLYKANANGVDLNVNFDAGWGMGVQNVNLAGTANYIGDRPFSESETRAIRDFTLQKKPAATVSYHAIGRELYWEYGQTEERLKRDELIAVFLNERLRYKIVGDDGTSAGGYKDWCIQALKIPSFTIELVSDIHSHPFTDYSKACGDIERNLDLPVRLSGAVNNPQFYRPDCLN